MIRRRVFAITEDQVQQLRLDEDPTAPLFWGQFVEKIKCFLCQTFFLQLSPIYIRILCVL